MLTNSNTQTSPPAEEAFARSLLIGSLLGLSWIAMQGVHELGHSLAAWTTGGQVVRVTLHPLTISRTDVAPNPAPEVVAWGGPVAGALLPLPLWLAFAQWHPPTAYLWRFFAGFCLTANGAYLAAGAITRTGDAGVLIGLGASPLSLAFAGLLFAASGLALWHRQGGHFGAGGRPVNRRHALLTTLAFVGVVIVLLVVDAR